VVVVVVDVVDVVVVVVVVVVPSDMGKLISSTKKVHGA
jgi:hypothetical protein